MSPRENLPYGILLINLHSYNVCKDDNQNLQNFENGIQLLACSIFILWGIILQKWNFSTVRYKHLR